MLCFPAVHFGDERLVCYKYSMILSVMGCLFYGRSDGSGGILLIVLNFHNLTDIVSENYQCCFKIFCGGKILKCQIIFELFNSAQFYLFVFFEFFLLKVF